MSSPYVSAAPTVSPVARSIWKSRFQSLFQSTPMPIMIIVSVIVLAVVIVFIFYKIKTGSLISTTLLPQQMISANANQGSFTIFPGGKVSNSAYGTEFSYSLWLYVDNITITNDHKNVMYRGNSTTFANGTFFVYMDAKTNTLYASVRTTGVLDETTAAQTPTLVDINQNKYFLKSTIDYVPLQRWVNVTYVVKDTTMTTFLDGDLYSVTSIYELPGKPDGSRPLISTQNGDVMMGGMTAAPGFNGYLGNIVYYNFSLDLAQGKTVYFKGPYKSTWLSYLGFSNVGLRSPIYKITAGTST